MEREVESRPSATETKQSLIQQQVNEITDYWLRQRHKGELSPELHLRRDMDRPLSTHHEGIFGREAINQSLEILGFDLGSELESFEKRKASGSFRAILASQKDPDLKLEIFADRPQRGDTIKESNQRLIDHAHRLMLYRVSSTKKI
jgi:hypothetical protein